MRSPITAMSRLPRKNYEVHSDYYMHGSRVKSV